PNDQHALSNGALTQATPADPPAPDLAPPRWDLFRRVAFRFVCAYLLLYIVPFPLYYIPVVSEITVPYTHFSNALVAWVGEHVFQVEAVYQISGSGDRTYNYVQLFCYVVLAALATALWSLLDRRRPSYARLHDWLRVYVRYYLAAMLIVYGAMKAIPVQFPEPDFTRLTQTYGERSPMVLLWT